MTEPYRSVADPFQSSPPFASYRIATDSDRLAAIIDLLENAANVERVRETVAEWFRYGKAAE